MHHCIVHIWNVCMNSPDINAFIVNILFCRKYASSRNIQRTVSRSIHTVSWLYKFEHSSTLRAFLFGVCITLTHYTHICVQYRLEIFSFMFDHYWHRKNEQNREECEIMKSPRVTRMILYGFMRSAILQTIKIKFSMRLCVHYNETAQRNTHICFSPLSLSCVCCQEWRLPDFGHIVPYILRYSKHSDSEMGK